MSKKSKKSFEKIHLTLRDILRPGILYANLEYNLEIDCTFWDRRHQNQKNYNLYTSHSDWMLKCLSKCLIKSIVFKCETFRFLCTNSTLKKKFRVFVNLIRTFWIIFLYATECVHIHKQQLISLWAFKVVVGKFCMCVQLNQVFVLYECIWVCSWFNEKDNEGTLAFMVRKTYTIRL